LKKIAIASGKGGTGKTTFALLLSKVLSKKYRVHLVDCDVEEPNCYLFLDFNEEGASKKDITVFTPDIDLKRCDYCGKCVEACKFKALILINNNFLKFNELCHPCKGCMLACPKNAIEEGQRSVGEKFFSKINENLFFSFARMTVTEARATPLITELKSDIKKTADFVIFDSPPGASCPVVEVIKETDYVFLVTEPTPFGLYDLDIAYEVVRELKKDVSIVINKSGENDYIIEKFARRNNIEIALKIPFSENFARKYSYGEIDIKEIPYLEEKIVSLFR